MKEVNELVTKITQ